MNLAADQIGVTANHANMLIIKNFSRVASKKKQRVFQMKAKGVG
jgi:hypothetical protein